MAISRKPRKAKKVQKTVYFDDDVWEALEKQMKMSRTGNVSISVNDGLRYAMFPEHRNDRDADLVKLYHQFSSSLAEHRKKTARDLAFIQEMILQAVKEQFMHANPIDDSELAARDAVATKKLDDFMENIVRNMPALKPLSDRD